MDNKLSSEKYLRAKKRVEEIKQFYKHLSVYLVINFVFIGRRIYKDIVYGDSVIEAFLDMDNYHFFFWWGIGLIIHGILVFAKPNIFSKNWEKRKINELMKKD
ncbi:2TM domain-containing protein [uncultured Polaribacter sp.]|uniref:2TM domain-containing protein n=1 Tax=uncultured Polaribacter sp. TaxID=174711 RepID=UPI00263310F2|nr:2TM domain-containing protein [uncultured Polaribacter sp.]